MRTRSGVRNACTDSRGARRLGQRTDLAHECATSQDAAPSAWGLSSTEAASTRRTRISRRTGTGAPPAPSSRRYPSSAASPIIRARFASGPANLTGWGATLHAAPGTTASATPPPAPAETPDTPRRPASRRLPVAGPCASRGSGRSRRGGERRSAWGWATSVRPEYFTSTRCAFMVTPRRTHTAESGWPP